jgi:2-C-methyl-D-erythritol 4-phosphate cytidylyltransferase
MHVVNAPLGVSTMSPSDTLKRIQEAMAFTPAMDMQKAMGAMMPQSDTLKRIQEAMAFTPAMDMQKAMGAMMPQSDTLKRIQEAMAFTPAMDMQKAMGAMMPQSDTLKRIQEAMAFTPAMDMQKAMGAMMPQSDTLKRIQEAMAFTPIMDMQKAMGAMMPQSDTLKRIQEAMAFTPAMDMQKAMGAIMPQSGALMKIQEAFASSDINWNEIDHNNLNGFSDKDSQVEDIGKHLSNFYEYLRQDIVNLEIAVERIVNEIQSLKSPFLQKILMYLVYPIIVGMIFSIVNPVADYYIKKHLQAKEGSLINVEAKLSVVSCKRLLVRSGPSREADQINVLNSGEIVTIIHQTGRWSQITWEKNGLIMSGWVYNRYLNALAN